MRSIIIIHEIYIKIKKELILENSISQIFRFYLKFFGKISPQDQEIFRDTFYKIYERQLNSIKFHEPIFVLSIIRYKIQSKILFTILSPLYEI